MSASLSENVILNNIKILALINILEPVTKTTVIKSLGNNINSKQIGLILSELTKDGFIAREKGRYRTTYKGSSFSISRKANKLRDIQRMKHLLVTSKQRGGGSVGR
jgi:predicted transcriptional regulator